MSLTNSLRDKKEIRLNLAIFYLRKEILNSKLLIFIPILFVWAYFFFWFFFYFFFLVDIYIFLSFVFFKYLRSYFNLGHFCDAIPMGQNRNYDIVWNFVKIFEIYTIYGNIEILLLLLSSIDDLGVIQFMFF